MPDFAIERSCAGLVCGVDEAGRGPLAGPVVAAAVILDRRRFRGTLRRELDDSKVLTRETREVCYRALFACAKIGMVSVGVGAASAREIDRINILRASLLAMARAVAALGVTPHHRRSFEPVRLALSGPGDLLALLEAEPLAAADD